MSDCNTNKTFQGLATEMNDKSGNKSATDQILEDFYKEKRSIAESYVKGEIDCTEFYLKSQEVVGKYMDKILELPKVSSMNIR